MKHPIPLIEPAPSGLYPRIFYTGVSLNKYHAGLDSEARKRVALADQLRAWGACAFEAVPEKFGDTMAKLSTITGAATDTECMAMADAMKA